MSLGRHVECACGPGTLLCLGLIRNLESDRTESQVCIYQNLTLIKSCEPQLSHKIKLTLFTSWSFGFNELKT